METKTVGVYRGKFQSKQKAFDDEAQILMNNECAGKNFPVHHKK